MPERLIVHVLDHALPVVSGYSVRSHHLLRALAQAGIRVMAVASSASPGACLQDDIDGVPYVRLPLRNADEPYNPANAAWSVARLSRWLAQAVRERGAAVLHAHSPATNGVSAWWAARRTGVPLVYEVRARWETAAVDRGVGKEGNLRFRIIEAMETWVLRRADAVTTISLGLIRDVERRGIARDRIFHVPNGIDTQRFQPRQADAELVERLGLRGYLVFGFLGYFFAYEGLSDLIDAFARIVPSLPHSKLLLVGEGEREADLRRQVARLGVGDHVVIAPAVPPSEVQRYYSVCDVLVYPRRSSVTTQATTPLKPLEAMAMGKPVVASDVGGLRELLQHEHTGLLVEAGNPQSLAETLRTIANDADLRRRLGENGRDYVVQERDWSHIVRVYVDLYTDLLEHPHAQARNVWPA
jgi:PEP-CTERM/exosortase A-associated glycosyltransferase